jgi:hypothetical protein
MASCAAIGNRRACRLPTGTQLAKLPHKRTSSSGHGTSVCILPYVDIDQATAVIERVSLKFIDLGNPRRSTSEFGNHIISLGLDDRRD